MDVKSSTTESEEISKDCLEIPQGYTNLTKRYEENEELQRRLTVMEFKEREAKLRYSL